jgi:hypothetical protein
MRCAYAHSLYVGCTDLVISITPNVATFYEWLGFKIVSEVKNYSPLKHDPVLLMRLSRVQTRWYADPPSPEKGFYFWKDFFTIENKYFSNVASWAALSKSLFSEPMEISPLLSNWREGKWGVHLLRNALRRRLGPVYRFSRRAAGRSFPTPVAAWQLADFSDLTASSVDWPIRIISKHRGHAAPMIRHAVARKHGRMRRVSLPPTRLLLELAKLKAKPDGADIKYETKTLAAKKRSSAPPSLKAESTMQ